MEESQKERPLGLTLLRLSWRHRKLLALVVGVAVLGSVVVTAPMFIAPRYRAEVVFYPAGANTSAGLLNSDARFGYDRDVDNAMQVLQSSIVRDSLVRKYDLLRHYEIDSTDPKRAFDLIEAYNDNVGVERTRYGSILVAVEDTDPRVAAQMANDMVQLGDRVKADIIRQNLRAAYQNAGHELQLKLGDLARLADSINYLRRQNYEEALRLRGSHYARKQQQVAHLRAALDRVRTEENIYDLGKQYNDVYKTYLTAEAHYLTDSGMVAVMSQRLSEADTALIHRRATLAGARLLTRDLQHQLRRLNRSGAGYNRLMDTYSTEKSVLSGLQGDYEFTLSSFDKEYDNLQLTTLKNKHLGELDLYKALKTKVELALSNLTDHVPVAYVVSPAEVATKPVGPRRLLLAALVGVSAWLLTLLGLLILENRDAIRRALA